MKTAMRIAEQANDSAIGGAKQAKIAEEAVKTAVRAAEEANERAMREDEQAEIAAEAVNTAMRAAEEGKERAIRDAKQAKITEQAAMKIAEREAKEAAKANAQSDSKKAREREMRAAEEKVSAQLYEGMVKLAIESPVDYDQMSRLGEYLRQTQHLRVILLGGSVDEGTKIVVFAEKPIPLINVLRGMPPVEKALKKEKVKEIQVTLRAKA